MNGSSRGYKQGRYLRALWLDKQFKRALRDAEYRKHLEAEKRIMEQKRKLGTNPNEEVAGIKPLDSDEPKSGSTLTKKEYKNPSEVIEPLEKTVKPKQNQTKTAENQLKNKAQEAEKEQKKVNPKKNIDNNLDYDVGEMPTEEPIGKGKNSATQIKGTSLEGAFEGLMKGVYGRGASKASKGGNGKGAKENLILWVNVTMQENNEARRVLRKLDNRRDEEMIESVKRLLQKYIEKSKKTKKKAALARTKRGRTGGAGLGRGMRVTLTEMLEAITDEKSGKIPHEDNKAMGKTGVNQKEKEYRYALAKWMLFIVYSASKYCLEKRNEGLKSLINIPKKSKGIRELSNEEFDQYLEKLLRKEVQPLAPRKSSTKGKEKVNDVNSLIRVYCLALAFVLHKDPKRPPVGGDELIAITANLLKEISKLSRKKDAEIAPIHQAKKRSNDIEAPGGVKEQVFMLESFPGTAKKYRESLHEFFEELYQPKPLVNTEIKKEALEQLKSNQYQLEDAINEGEKGLMIAEKKNEEVKNVLFKSSTISSNDYKNVNNNMAEGVEVSWKGGDLI